MKRQVAHASKAREGRLLPWCSVIVHRWAHLGVCMGLGEVAEERVEHLGVQRVDWGVVQRDHCDAAGVHLHEGSGRLGGRHAGERAVAGVDLLDADCWGLIERLQGVSAGSCVSLFVAGTCGRGDT